MMSFEQYPGFEHASDNVEYSMIAGQLHALFEDAVTQQTVMGNFRMFTLMEAEEGRPEPLGRFRLMDSLQAEADLRSSGEFWIMDVALPLEAPDITMPRLSRTHDYFVAFARNTEVEAEQAVTVHGKTAEQDLRILHELMPHFMSRVLVATVVPMKKSSS